MQAIITAVQAVFNWLFVGTTGSSGTDPAIKSVISFVVSEPYLLIGLGLMLAGATLSFLRKIIRST